MKILLLLLILGLSGCLNSNNDREQDKIKKLEKQRIITDTTQITVRIPSKVSDKKLEITLPRCMFGFSKRIKLLMVQSSNLEHQLYLPYPLYQVFPMMKKQFIDVLIFLSLL